MERKCAIIWFVLWFQSFCFVTIADTSSCLIKQDSASVVGTPTTDGGSETTYSCVASDNCNYEVHVIGNYESSNGRHGFFTERVAGDTDVIVSVSGESPRPLILVLTSYEPVRWRLSVTRGVIIDRVILSGYYASTVTSSPSNAIRQTETLRDPDNHYGYGTDNGGGGTAELLLYLQQRFGPVTSFSGSYRADLWELNIHRTPACSFNNMTRNCPVPSAPENGAVNVTGVQPIVAKYSCHEGTLVGPKMRICLESGWSGEEPSCRTGFVCTATAIRDCAGSSNYCGILPSPSDIYGYADLTCEENHCRCSAMEHYDYCTCLPHIGSCLIEKDSENRVVNPTSGGIPETTYSCVASDNCNYEVHVIGNYESSNGRHGFFTERVAGDTDVIVSVSGESPRPLILVLTSYEPVRWRLSVTNGITIDRVILSSYYNSTVSSSPASAIRLTEILSRSEGIRGYGSDIGGGKTADLLLYLQGRFGPVTSFSGSYRASRWELNIKRRAECGWASTACQNLSPPANGRVDISSLEPETTVRYSCNVGFQLSGNRVRTCLESGLWSGQAPNCTKHLCPPLSPPSNGKVMFSDTRPFSSATYTCDSGFGLVGQSVRTCEQSGSWSREPPVCVASVSYTSPPKSDTSTSSSSSGVSIGVAIAVLVLVGTVVLVVARVWFLLHRHRSLSRVSHQRSSPPVPTIPAHETTISHPPLSNPPLSTETKLAEESTFSAMSDKPPDYHQAVNLPSADSPPSYSSQ